MERAAQGSATDADAILALIGSINSRTDGVELAYQALDLVVARYRLASAELVLHPTTMATQIFVHGRLHVPPDRAAELARRPSGLYTSPESVPMAVRDALTGCCEIALAAHAARLRTEGGIEGLASRPAIEEAVRCAASRSGRFRWRFAMVVLATAGPAAPGERWQALASVVRDARRACDEAGVAGDGRAVAILAGAGPEDVEPYVERLRGHLREHAAVGTEVLAGWATAPGDSVDADQLWRLCEQRLAAAADSSGAGGERRPTDASHARRRPPSELELELRCLPDVVSVGTTGLTGPDARVRSVTVIAQARGDDRLRRRASELAEARLGDVSVTVLDGGGSSAPVPAAGSPGANGSATNGATPPGAGETGETGEHARKPAGEAGAAGAAGEAGGAGEAEIGTAGTRSATERRRDGAAPRIVLVRSELDRATGITEVALDWHGVRAVGRATGNPLTGAAQATLTALEALGAVVPYYLTAVEHVATTPGSPVVVALAERGVPNGGQRRVGVADGDDEVQAASRATLAAVNRLLSRTDDAR